MKNIFFETRKKLWSVYVDMVDIDMDTDNILECIYELDSMLCEQACREFCVEHNLDWDINAFVDGVLQRAYTVDIRQDDCTYEIEVKNYRDPSGSCVEIKF